MSRRPAGSGSGASWPRDPVLRLCRHMLRFAAGRLGPLRRTEWLAEWEGELWALHARGVTRWGLLRFAIDGIGEARWEKRLEEGLMGGIVQDARMTLRRLAKSPGFAGIVILVLALGIGANTALFGALRAALLNSPPYPDPDRIVTLDLLFRTEPGSPPDTMPWSWPKFEAMREDIASVNQVAGWVQATNSLTGDGLPTRVSVEYVTPAYWELLGVRASVGRLFGEAEAVPGPGLVAVLSDGLWRTRWGGDPSAVGQTLTLDGVTLEIVGVAPAGFEGVSGAAELWVPVSGIAAIRGPRRLQLAWAHWLNGLGRLAPGTTLEQARAEGELLGAALTEEFPDPSGSGEESVTMVPFMAARVNPVARLAVSAVAVAGFLLLLIACGNVAGLLLARAGARRVDSAVRVTLGAGRGRLLRETLMESLFLASAGGALGLLLAVAGRNLIAVAARTALDLNGTRGLQFLATDSMTVDTTVLAVGVGFALLTGLLTGLLPARSVWRSEPGIVLRGGRTPVGRTPAAGSVRAILVGTQLALTLVLLSGAGLMAASFARLTSVDTGFTNGNVLALTFDRGPGVSSGESRVFEATLIERAEAIPGVRRAAIAPCAPLTGRCEVVGLRELDGIAPASPVPLLAYPVSEAYFETLGIAVSEGRVFVAADGPGSPPVVVINRAAADRLFGGGPAIGHEIAITHELTPEDGVPARIVGVVADVPYGSLEEGAMPAVYLSRSQASVPWGTLFLAATGDARRLVSPIREMVAGLDATLPLYSITTLDEVEASARARTRVVLYLLGAFAVTGLLLSAIGLYGIVAWSVVRRRPEMGLRLALGAATRDVASLVMRPPVRVAAIGTAAGLAGAFALTRYLQALLFGVRASDPRILALSAAVLLAVALGAAWIPTRRALRLDPADALRDAGS